LSVARPPRPPSFARRLVPSKSFFPPKERESHQPCIRLPPASPLRFHSISLVQFCCCILQFPVLALHSLSILSQFKFSATTFKLTTLGDYVRRS
jgi:hypothetical protein